MQQFEINFEAGLTQRYETLMDCVRGVVERSSRQKKAIAADLDKSQSEFSRELNENDGDQRYFKVRDLSNLIDACGPVGHDVIHWLVEKHLEDPDTRKKRAQEMLTQMLPQLMKLIEEANK